MPKKIKKILITRTDRIGDLVLSTPIFAAIRAKYPDVWLSALSFQENREILEGNPYLNEVILYDKKGSEKGVLGQISFSGKIRKKRFDVVIHLHSTNRMHVMSWLAGIPVRIGWKRKSSWALTKAYPDLKKEGLRHEAEYNFELLKEMGIQKPEILKSFFPVSPKAVSSLESLFRHLGISFHKTWVVISPSASCPSKRWPAQRFGEVVRRLSSDLDILFLGVGSSVEKNLVEEVRKSAGNDLFPRFWNLAGLLNLSTLGALLQKSTLLISNDSGPVHIASAVGTPSVSIFGRNQQGLSPARWRPLHPDSKVAWKNIGCDPCLAHNCQIGFLCLDVVLPKEVVDLAKTFLNK